MGNNQEQIKESIKRLSSIERRGLRTDVSKQHVTYNNQPISIRRHRGSVSGDKDCQGCLFDLLHNDVPYVLQTLRNTQGLEGQLESSRKNLSTMVNSRKALIKDIEQIKIAEKSMVYEIEALKQKIDYLESQLERAQHMNATLQKDLNQLNDNFAKEKEEMFHEIQKLKQMEQEAREEIRALEKINSERVDR